MWSPESEWTLGRIEFVADGIDPDRRFGSWAGHRQFVYDLLRWGNPDLVVELGAHYGVSFFAMCQAVRDGAKVKSLHPIDTWEGDEHAGFYGSEVFEVFSGIAESEFADEPIDIKRSLFDEVVGDYAASSIDLLHIDGLHTYDAVKHDFETWKDKVAPDGIVLFHDIDESTGFGTVDYWLEISPDYPSLEFHHSYGLGILFPNGDRWRKEISQMLEEYGAITYPAVGNADLMRAEFDRSASHASNLEGAGETQAQAIEELRNTVKSLNGSVRDLRSAASDLEGLNLDLHNKLLVSRDAAKGATAAMGAALGQLAVFRNRQAASDYRDHVWETEVSQLRQDADTAKEELEAVTGSRSWRLASYAGLPIRLLRRIMR